MNKVFSLSTDKPYTTEMEYTLTCCGLVVRQYRTDSGAAGWEERNKEALNYWADSRVSRHRCGLVNDSNPMGQLPRGEKK